MRTKSIFLIAALLSGSVSAQTVVQGGYSTEPLRHPLFDSAQVTVETVAINNWLNSNYQRLSEEEKKGPREHLYYLIDSRIKEIYARTGKVLPDEHDVLLERLFSWSERLGVYGGTLVYNRLRGPSAKAMSSNLRTPKDLSIKLAGDLLTVGSTTGRWSVEFPYYFMVWSLADFEARNRLRTQLVALSTGAAKDKSQAGHSQGTLLFIYSPAANAESFVASWKEQFGVNGQAETKRLGVKNLRSVHRFDPQSQLHTEFTSWTEKQGPFAVVYMGMDGTYQWNRPHFVDFVRKVRIE